MRTRQQIETMIWLLNEDPNADQVKQFFTRFREVQPVPMEVFNMLGDAERVYQKGDPHKPADFSALTWFSKRLMLVAWILERDDIANAMKAIPYGGWQSMGHKVKRFRELYEGETNDGEAQETSVGSN